MWTVQGFQAGEAVDSDGGSHLSARAVRQGRPGRRGGAAGGWPCHRRPGALALQDLGHDGRLRRRRGRRGGRGRGDGPADQAGEAAQQPDLGGHGGSARGRWRGRRSAATAGSSGAQIHRPYSARGLSLDLDDEALVFSVQPHQDAGEAVQGLEADQAADEDRLSSRRRGSVRQGRPRRGRSSGLRCGLRTI